MATQEKQSTAGTNGTDKEVESVEQCAEIIIDHVKQLRQEQGFGDGENVSIYITDVPLVHSTLSEYSDKIEKATGASDIVQVNVQAGNPMPEDLPRHEITVFSKEPVVVAIEKV